MDPDTEIHIDCYPMIRIYKSGRIERHPGTQTPAVPAAFDPTTGVTSKDITIDADTGVSTRLYLPDNPQSKLPILVYYHGGAFCIESAFSPTYHRLLNSLASKANLLVVSVEYRLAPEHLLPAAYDDSWLATKWAFLPGADPWLTQFGDFTRVFLAGDSAGANIAHHMAMRASEKEHEDMKIEGMVLIHPFFWGSEPIGSESRDPEKRGWADGLWKMVNPPGVEVDDPMINLKAEGAPSLAGLRCKWVMVCVAENDGLAERGRAHCEILKESGWGGAVELFESEGEGHVFHHQKPESDKALELMERMVAFFKK